MHIILHIGPYKTGSTSIQMALQEGREALAEQRCLYYCADKYSERALSIRYLSEKNAIDPGLMRGFDTRKDAMEWSEGCWVELEGLVNSGDFDTAIISSEHMSGPQIRVGQMVERLRKISDKITVVFYVRDPVDLYASLVQQHIRSGVRLEHLPSLVDYEFSARQQMERYIEAVGIENCVVRNFVRSNLVDGDAVEDFAAVVSKVAQPITLPAAYANESFPGAAIAWLLTVNGTYDRKTQSDERRKLVRRLKNSAALAKLPKMKMTAPGLRKLIQHQTREDCVWFNKTFLQDQEKLVLVDRDTPEITVNAIEAHKRVRNWILGYLTPEAVPLVAKEFVLIKYKKKADQKQKDNSI